MDLKIEMLFGMNYPFMNTEHMFLQNDTNTIGGGLFTWINPVNIH